MSILDTYTISTTDKLDLGLKPNEPYYIKKIERSSNKEKQAAESYEIHYTCVPELLIDGEEVSK